jgi:phage host-nuclease inhibitor protein Gam
MPKKLIPLPEQVTSSTDFRNLVDLFAVLSEATDRQTILQATLNQEARELVDAHRPEIVELTTTIAHSKEAIETLCRHHREWFKDSKTLRTAYGVASFRASSKINAPNEDAAIVLLKAAGRFDLVRTVEALDLEALEKLDDKALAAFGLVRVAEESFAVKPGKVDLGKGVAENGKEEQAA